MMNCARRRNQPPLQTAAQKKMTVRDDPDGCGFRIGKKNKLGELCQKD